ncbi:MAG: ATP-binding protein [Bacteroidales bacterium]|nr:ATP-binding protein [Bacteroidales bacterium]
MKLIHCGLANRSWRTDRIGLFSQNLLVGKNSVGKSTLIRGLSHMASLLSQRRPLGNNEDIACLIAIEDEKFTAIYRFAWNDAKVQDEFLSVVYDDGHKKVWIERTAETAKFEGEVVNPPQDKLLLNLKRDTVLYQEIESIISWAENVDAFSFNEFDIDGDDRLYSRFINGGDNLYSMLRTLDKDSIDNVLKTAADMDYHLDKIEAVEFADIKKVLFVEKNVVEPLFDVTLSKGMFRTLYLLIYLEYVTKSGKPATLLIDDLCEGLDYDRSTKLGKYVFDYCSKNDIQLIASSNDSFLMDVVDLNYWSILQRDGSKVSSINCENNPELFEDFSFTGLSNFDLLSSDFIARHNKKK